MPSLSRGLEQARQAYAAGERRAERLCAPLRAAIGTAALRPYYQPLVDLKSGRIEAAATSFWFGQVTDIVIRIRPAGTEGARLDARAQSEKGVQDFGHNLMLLKDFFQALSS